MAAVFLTDAQSNDALAVSGTWLDIQAMQYSTTSPDYYVGVAGGACPTGTVYAWPDANGNVLKCVSNVWQVQNLSGVAAGGSNTQVQYNSSGALAGDSGFTYAGSGAVSITGALTSLQSIGTSSTDGLALSNTTAATSSVQQYSPRLHFSGQGWKSNATAASQSVDFIEEVQTGRGTTSATGSLIWSNSVNGAAYSPRMTITKAGSVAIGTTTATALFDVLGSSSNATVAAFRGISSGTGVPNYVSAAIDNTNGSTYKSTLKFNANGTTKWELGDDYFGAGQQSFFIHDVGDASVPFYIDSTGKVGIGTFPNTLNAPLEVNGAIMTDCNTVAALPTGQKGMRHCVTDATSCTFLGAVTGGGSTFCPVVYNGSAWVGG